MNLNYDVFSVDPKPIPSQIPGFEQAVGQATWPPSTSTLIWSDDGGALLVDCLITTTEAAALATWIRSHGRELEYVYITHPHADHLLGLPLVLDAYPNAKPVALAESISAMETQVSPAYLNVWSAYFPGQLPDRPVVPTPLSSTSIPIGDEVATVVPVGTTDSDLSTVLHVPGPRPGRLRRCGLQPDPHVVEEIHAGVKGQLETRARCSRRASAPTRSSLAIGIRKQSTMTAQRQIEESRQYIADFEAALARSSSPLELIDRMMAIHGDRANPYTLWVAAYDLLGEKPA